MPATGKRRGDFAHEIAVLYWESEVAAAAARLAILKPRLSRGPGDEPPAEWNRFVDLEYSARVALDDARDNLKDARRNRYATRPDGEFASTDQFLEPGPIA